MASSDGYETPQASFMGPPPESRCRIYEFALRLESTSGKYHLSLTGNNEEVPSKSKHAISTLPLLCRLVYLEFSRVQPSVSDITFTFKNFTLVDMASWLKQMGRKRLSQMQRWKFEGRAQCLGQHDRSFPVVLMCRSRIEEPCPVNCVHEVRAAKDRIRALEMQGFCHRSLGIDLSKWEQYLAVRGVRLRGSRHEDFFDIEDLRKSGVIDSLQMCDLPIMFDSDCFATGYRKLEASMTDLIQVDKAWLVSKWRFFKAFKAVMSDHCVGLPRGQSQLARYKSVFLHGRDSEDEYIYSSDSEQSDADDSESLDGDDAIDANVIAESIAEQAIDQ